ncbi:MAG: hypothetical protein WC541_06255, partial [Dehalococcoidia bacterium]
MKQSSLARVSLELRPSGAGYSQTFLSEDDRILLRGEPGGDIVLELKGKRGRLLPYTSASGLSASIERSDLKIETTFSETTGAHGYDVTSRLTAFEPLQIVAFGHAYVFPPGAGRATGDPLDYAWIPTLKSRRKDVAGDHTFRSPCIIACHGGLQAALVPNLDLYTSNPLRSALDLDLPRKADDLAPRLSYVMQDCRPHGHIFYSPTGSLAMLQPGDTLRMGFTLLFDLETGPFSHQQVLRFLWQRYGRRQLTSSIAPQILPFEQYARLSFENTLESYGLWRGFKLAGKDCGGLCGRIVRPNLSRGSKKLPNDTTLGVALNYLFTPTLSLREKMELIKWNNKGIHPHLWNTMFLNNVRTSFGLMYYGRSWRDRGLEERARCMWNLALS